MFQFRLSRPRGQWVKAGLAVFALLAGVVLVPLVPLHAGAAPKPTIEQVRKRIKELNEQAEVASERYNDLREQIAGLNVRLAATKTKVEEQKKVVARARAELAKVAADTYKAGDMASLELFFSDRPDDYVHANGLLMGLDERKKQAMDDVLRQQQQLVAMMTDIQAQEQKLEKARKDLQATRVEVERKLEEQRAVLAGLTDDDRSRLTRIEEGETRESLEQQGITVPKSGRLGCDDVPVAPPDPRVAKVIAYACAQLGDPYHWGGDGPTNFDCSGLTMMAWKQAGVSLPHSSQLQARYGKKVRVSDLRPGDLVFFHSALSHVGIYVGKGAMLHAPRTGQFVEIQGLKGRTIVTAVRL